MQHSGKLRYLRRRSGKRQIRSQVSPTIPVTVSASASIFNFLSSLLSYDPKMAEPKHLTGDKAAIEEFLSKFDVSPTSHVGSQRCVTMTNMFPDFLVRLRWYASASFRTRASPRAYLQESADRIPSRSEPAHKE